MHITPCHSPTGQCSSLQRPCTLPRIGRQRALSGAGRGRSRETRQNAWQASSTTQNSVRDLGLSKTRETTAARESATDGWDEWGDLAGMAPQISDTTDFRGDQQSAEPLTRDTDSTSSSLHGEQVDFITGQRYSQAQVSSPVLSAQAAALGQFYASAPAQPYQSSMLAFADLPRWLGRLGEGAYIWNAPPKCHGALELSRRRPPGSGTQ